jgi:peptidoglycan/LPS O-acetylase OafA/YrhL
MDKPNIKVDKPYINTVVFLRFFAAFCVLWIHICSDVPKFLSDDSIYKMIARFAYGVDIFFIISGFIIPWSLYHSGYKLKKFGTFLLKRITRLDPPYIATILIIICLKLWHRDEINYKAVIFHLGYLNAFIGYPWLSSVFWTLAIEFQYYLLIGLFYVFITSHKKTTRYWAISIFGISLIVPSFGFNISYPHTIFAYSHLFLFGIFTFLYKKRLIDRERFLFFMILVLLLVARSANFTKVILWLWVIAMILFFNFQNKITNFLGSISYSLYLTHEIIGGRVINYLWHNSHLYKEVIMLIAIGACISFAYVFYLLVERPSMLLSKRIRYE